MKKIYIKPETEEVKLRIANQLLAGSGESGSYGNPSITEPEDDPQDI